MTVIKREISLTPEYLATLTKVLLDEDFFAFTPVFTFSASDPIGSNLLLNYKDGARLIEPCPYRLF
jgi:hypothetical protein